MSFFNRIGSKLYGYATSKLPDYITNQTAIQAKQRISKKIDRYNEAIAQKTGAYFTHHVKEIHKNFEKEKETCQRTISRLNGAYYHDPKSELKQAWDKLVAVVKSALGIDIVSRDQLPSITGLPSEVQIDIADYLAKEKVRDTNLKRLNEILMIQKPVQSSPKVFDALVAEKAKLQLRQVELCGAYYGDSTSLLDQAWNDSVASGVDSYQVLEEERRSNESRLINLDEQLLLPADLTRNYEVLAQSELIQKVNQLTLDRALIKA